MGKQRRYTDEQLRNAVQSSTSTRGVLSCLGLAEAGGNYAVIQTRIALLGLDVRHFRGQGWRKGVSRPPKAAQDLTAILVAGSRCRTSHLRLRLIRENLKEARCELCGGMEWQGQPMPLELDHINGDRVDNRLENLRLVCPNCHAPTYRGKNIGTCRDFTEAA